jgi:hypothetical protein
MVWSERSVFGYSSLAHGFNLIKTRDHVYASKRDPVSRKEEGDKKSQKMREKFHTKFPDCSHRYHFRK